MTQKGKPQKHYLGVDPGKNGGLCVLRSDGEPMEYDRMPDGKGLSKIKQSGHDRRTCKQSTIQITRRDTMSENPFVKKKLVKFDAVYQDNKIGSKNGTQSNN